MSKISKILDGETDSIDGILENIETKDILFVSSTHLSTLWMWNDLFGHTKTYCPTRSF